MKIVLFPFTAMLVLFAALLVLFATPFWIPELLFSREALKSAKRAKLGHEESVLDWMFSLRDPLPHSSTQSFVRLWGVEFRYHDSAGGLQGFM